MYKNRTVGVVVPAYNEEGFVGEVIDTVPEFVDRVYAIDDCSTDETWAEILQHAETQNRAASRTVGSEVARPPLVEGKDISRPAGRLGEEPSEEDEEDRELVRADGGQAAPRRVVPVRHEENRGVGAAIKTGYRHALRDGMDVVAVMNGDGQMDPDILDRIIDPVVEEEADYAKGNRLCGAGTEEMPPWRLFGNLLLTVLTKISSGYWDVLDPQNGYTAISRTALERLDLDDVYESYGFLNALLVRMNARGMTVTDVPMRPKYGDEKSGIRYGSFVPNLSVLLVSAFLWRLRAKYLPDSVPAVLYPLGTAGVSLGGGGTLATLALRDPTASLPWALLILVSVVALGSALGLELRSLDGSEVDSSRGEAVR